MSKPFWCVAAACLTFGASSASGQRPAPADSELARSAGHWVASGVSFQSGRATHPFAVDVKPMEHRLQISVPPELALPGGRTYQLDRAAPGVFLHVDGAGRVVEFSPKSATSASLLITGSGGDGRVTWQLTRS